MGWLPSPRLLRARSSRPARTSLWLGPALLFALATASLGTATHPAHSATLNDKISQSSGSTGQGKDRVLVQAREMVYDRNKNSVEARGDVQLYYQGRVLQADRVVYDRDRNRVFAEGHAKLTERDGTVTSANRFDLTEDFKEGFVDSLSADTADKTHMTAARAERSGGNVTVLERGTYTACPACEENPGKPPLWQIRAKRIIHNNDEQMVYYEDASLEFLGTPIAYIPYFSTPDPSVERKSGILAPSYQVNSNLGVGVGVPIYWAMAPNYDLTVTPTFYSRQGLYLQTEWRHQLANGAYSLRLSGIFQNDPTAFQASPYGAGNRNFRGALETQGQFYLNDKWKFGWDVNLVSDRWFMQDYRLPAGSLSSNYFRESTSTAYLTGQGARSYFDLRGYYFQGTSSSDLQAQQPVVAPVLDYNRTVSIDPAKSGGIGGQIEIDGNLTHVSRALAAYESTGARTLDSVNSLYDVCSPQNALYTRANCLVSGMGGDYTRATMNLSWKRQFIDPIGQVWTPFAFAHVNGGFLNLNTTNSQTFGAASTITNASQANFFGADNNTWLGSATPGAGVEYRYPFVMANAWATQVFEPIAQVIVRPNEPVNNSLVNEDSQSLVFDDTNLFDWSKYSGYDRFEGGTRANYGGQYTITLRNGGYANFMVGQSYQLAGTNSYAMADVANIGLSSGLDTRRSDIVSRFSIAPNSSFAFIAKARFDPGDYTLRRLDLTSTARYGSFEGTLQYARYEAQPLIGYNVRREGISTALKYKFDKHYFTSGNVIFDLSRHLYDSNPAIGGRTPLFSVAGMGLGVGYTDDCTTFAVNYTSVYQDSGFNSTPVRNQSVVMQLQLRTLGDTRVQSSLSDIKVQDGLNSSSATR